MNNPMVSATLIQETAPTTGVPIDVLESLLRDVLADQIVAITDWASAPLPHQGTNDSTAFFRVTLTWRRSSRSIGSQTTTWILKHWKAGGVRDSALGITQPREVLAWERGWLRPAALPAGIVVPFIGARRSPDNTEGWLAMADVSTGLSAYSRLDLSGDQAIGRAQTILARLARFHAVWEQPERLAELQACPWLWRPEIYLWDLAPTYARALGRPPVAQVPPGASGPPVWDGLGADLDAFLEGRPAGERRLWEQLLIDRHALVEGLVPYPQTLLHNDLDDRNIGLRWSGGGADTESVELSQPDLVLIDWEWMALGPAAIDVANIVQRLPIMITPGTPVPQAIWTDELADFYFEHYRAAGGRCVDAARWRRSYGLARVAQALAQMPFVHGRLRRAIRGLPMMEQMEECVVREARRWLG
jgi:hypothetical protein